MKIGIVSDTHFGYDRWGADAFEQGRDALLSASAECDFLILREIFLTPASPP